MEQNALHDFGFIVWPNSMIIKSEGIQFLTLHNREASMCFIDYYYAASIALTLLYTVADFFSVVTHHHEQVPLRSNPGVSCRIWSRGTRHVNIILFYTIN